MGITELQCPECGADVSMGLPNDAVVQSVTATDCEASGERQKVRLLACPNGHEFFVRFEW